MRFSYSLIKQLVPKVKSKKELVNTLTAYSFEASDLPGDAFEATIPPNRYSDAASHWGIAKEASQAMGIPSGIHEVISELERMPVEQGAAGAGLFTAAIEDTLLCNRYRVQYFENVSLKLSPKWMQDILIDCGLRPINAVVDIMNYVMLESGQPLHAFDFDKIIEGGGPHASPVSIIVRRARRHERIKTLDEKEYELGTDVLVIANAAGPIALAGIKGGKDAEVTEKTKRIIVEAANFNARHIYASSRRLGLQTDASLRFSHALSPALVPIGLNRAGELLVGLTMATAGATLDIRHDTPKKKTITFDIREANKLIGADLDPHMVRRIFTLLGFTTKIAASSPDPYPTKDFLVEVPALRTDIETPLDLAEEIVRLHGYNSIQSIPPRIHLLPVKTEDSFTLRDTARIILTSFGYSEVYNRSFIGEKDMRGEGGEKARVLAVKNPISAEYAYMRPNLGMLLFQNIESNFRFFENPKVFEIGDVFSSGAKNDVREKTMLGIAIGSKSKEAFFELKGVADALLKRLGLVDFRIVPFREKGKQPQVVPGFLDQKSMVEIKSGDASLGYVGIGSSALKGGFAAFAEINLNELLTLVSEEREYKPLTKYPSVLRDISLSLPQSAGIGDIMQAIQETDLKEIEDVDLIDEYKNSFTFRIVFQADNRTLTDAEVNRKMETVYAVLQKRFNATIR